MSQGKLVPFNLREQLRADKAAGKTVRQIAEERDLNKETVVRWTGNNIRTKPLK